MIAYLFKICKVSFKITVKHTVVLNSRDAVLTMYIKFEVLILNLSLNIGWVRNLTYTLKIRELRSPEFRVRAYLAVVRTSERCTGSSPTYDVEFVSVISDSHLP